MNLFLYISSENGVGQRLKQVVGAVVPDGNMETCRSVDDLARSLRQPRGDKTVVVLLASTKQDLLDLLKVDFLLTDTRIIIILPDREPETLAQGHHLRPRFLGFIDSDLSEVAGVLGYMLGRMRSTEN